MNIMEALKATKAVIDTPEKWTQVAFARNASGEAVSAFDSSAVCYCLRGALTKATAGMGDNREARAAIVWAIKGLNYHYSIIYVFNDHPDTTHAMVMAVLDKAIETATQGLEKVT